MSSEKSDVDYLLAAATAWLGGGLGGFSAAKLLDMYGTRTISEYGYEFQGLGMVVMVGVAGAVLASFSLSWLILRLREHSDAIVVSIILTIPVAILAVIFVPAVWGSS